MEQYNWQAFSAAYEAREKREKLMILAGIAGVIIYIWVLYAFDPMSAEKLKLQQQFTIANSQVIEEESRYAQIQASYNTDPNESLRQRQAGLQNTTIEIDEQLDQRYGELISPTEMAEVLALILQRETTLKIIALENLLSEQIFTADLGTAVPLVGGTPEGVISNIELAESNDIDNVEETEQGLQVFKHGLLLTFEGNFLETIRYLQSLESLNPNFYWDNLVFSIDDAGFGIINLQIFTLSTQKEWIGV